MIVRLGLMVVMMVGVVVAVLGCGDDTPRFDAATQYSPESLAQELSFRYASLDSKSRQMTPVYTNKKTGDATRREMTKDATTKNAPEENLDSLVADIRRKADTIPNLPPGSARNSVADAVDRDSSILDDGKKAIVAALRRSD